MAVAMPYYPQRCLRAAFLDRTAECFAWDRPDGPEQQAGCSSGGVSQLPPPGTALPVPGLFGSLAHACCLFWLLDRLPVPACRLQVGLIASLKNEHKHNIVEQALTALGCMEHRGACSADDVSGDGAGVMTKIPWGLFKAEMPQLNEDTTG